MTIKPVDAQDISLMIELNRWQIVWQGRPNLGVEFEDARFCQSWDDRIRTTQYISRKQAALLLSCSDQSISKLIKIGKLPAYRLGRAVRIKLGDLHAALEVHRER